MDDDRERSLGKFMDDTNVVSPTRVGDTKNGRFSPETLW